MGNLCCNRKKRKKKIVLLLVGLDNAGKSVAVKGLAGESLDTTLPTVGLSVVNLKYNNHTVKIFDLGGGSNIRGIWERYFVDVHGVIFVVDASDYPRLDEVKLVLDELLSNEKITGKPILILANKQDRQDALDEIDLIEKLQIEFLVNKRKCPTLVETCTATETTIKSMDRGIQKGYRWLLNFIIRDYRNLNERVKSDVREQEIEERHARLEKIERLKRLEMNRRDDDIIESFSEYDRKMNRENNMEEQQTDIFYIQTSNNNSDVASLSSRSTESFPHLYYTNLDEQPDLLLARPKSAVQLVKEQLQLECVERKHSLKLVPNKTTPVNLYNVGHPRSANVQRRQHLVSKRRALKSAGDSRLVVTNLPNAVVPDSQGDLHRELFHLNNFQRTRKLPPIQLLNTKDVANNMETAISLVDIN